MSKYRPGTADASLVIERRANKRMRETRALSIPTAAQTYGTTERVKELDLNISAIEEEVQNASKEAFEAKEIAEKALAASGDATYKFVDITDEEIEKMFKED